MEITCKWLKERWFKKVPINNYYYKKEFDNWNYIREITFSDDCNYVDICDYSKTEKEKLPFWWSGNKILLKEQYIRNITKYSDIDIIWKCDRDFLIWFLKSTCK